MGLPRHMSGRPDTRPPATCTPSAHVAQPQPLLLSPASAHAARAHAPRRRLAPLVLGALATALLLSCVGAPAPVLAETSSDVELARIRRGVRPDLREHYDPARFGALECPSALDGSSIRVPWSAVNDDYCDCANGADEPGTSACPNSQFYCPNEGHVAENILSSRVNDGICDCCDGSDEYKPGVTCPNRCKEAHEEAMRIENERKERLARGSRIRKEWMDYAAQQRASRSKELQQIAEDLNVIDTKIPEIQAAKETSEKLHSVKHSAQRRKELRVQRTFCPARLDHAKSLLERERAHSAKLTKMLRALTDRHEGTLKSLVSMDAEMAKLRADPEFGKTPRVRALLDLWVAVEDASHMSNYAKGHSILSDDEFISDPEDVEAGEEYQKQLPDFANSHVTDEEVKQIDAITQYPANRLHEFFTADEIASGKFAHELRVTTSPSSQQAQQHEQEPSAHATDAHGHVHTAQDLLASDICLDPQFGLLDCYRATVRDTWNTAVGIIWGGYMHPVWSRTWGFAWGGRMPAHHATSQQQNSYDSEVSREAGSPTGPAPPAAVPVIDTVSAIPTVSSLTTQDPAHVSATLTAVFNLKQRLIARRDDLNRHTGANYGPLGEWEKVAGQCVEVMANSFTYSICFLDKATQRMSDGRVSTLGYFRGFHPRGAGKDAEKEPPTHLLFADGEYCWQGPNRSLEVELECGPDIQFVAASEPSKCEYSGKLLIPAACPLPQEP